MKRIAYGFSSYENYLAFSHSIRNFLESIGVHDAEVFFVGSAATGRSFEKGDPYDVGRVSDVEIEIRSRILYELQIQKFSDLLNTYRTRYLPEYQKAYNEAKTREQKKTANDGLLKIKGIINRLKKILEGRKLPPNYKLPLGFQDLQYKILPSYTDRPSMKVGIRISHPDVPESSDVNKSSLRLF